MVARAYTVAFQGLEARLVEVQVAVLPGLPGFSVVGLPDKAVTEAKRTGARGAQRRCRLRCRPSGSR
jgi:hypothetical protein